MFNWMNPIPPKNLPTQVLSHQLGNRRRSLSAQPTSEPANPSSEPSDTSLPIDTGQPSNPSSEPSQPTSEPSSQPSEPASQPSQPVTEPSTVIYVNIYFGRGAILFTNGLTEWFVWKAMRSRLAQNSAVQKISHY